MNYHLGLQIVICYFRNLDMSIAFIIISCKIANSFNWENTPAVPGKLPRDDYCISIVKSSIETKAFFYRG